MKQPLLLLFLSTQFFLSQAQPGGGGGLNISYLFSWKGDTLELNDASLIINRGALNHNGSKVVAVPKPYSVQSYRYATGERKWLYLPPDYPETRSAYTPNQRLEIIYKGDTMTIDFIGIMGENGAGMADQLNCIYFFPGHYVMHRTKSDLFREIWANPDVPRDQKEKLREDLRSGINYGPTLSNLTGWKVLQITPHPKAEEIKLRYERLRCNEAALDDDFVSLCESMMELKPGRIDIRTRQVGVMQGDTLTHRFVYYFTFDAIQNRMGSYPYEELALAQTYLAALESRTCYVNGLNYTGKIIVRIPQRNVPSLFGYSSDPSELHYLYYKGRFIRKYASLREGPAYYQPGMIKH